MLKLTIAASCALLLLNSCTKSENVIIETEPQEEVRTFPKVDERLWSYFIVFEVEAKIRGYTFDLEKLDINGFILDIPERGVAGYCEYGSHIENEVTIDSEFWSRSNQITREFVVFHELGHCVLMRDHKEAQNSGGRCLSIMRSGTGNCSDHYNQQTRASYIDELFAHSNL